MSLEDLKPPEPLDQASRAPAPGPGEPPAPQVEDPCFRTIFLASPVAMCLTTLAEGRLILANQAMLALLGRRSEDVIGHTTVELGLFGDAAERQARLQKLRARGRLGGDAWFLRRPDGGEVVLSWHADPLELEQVPCLLVTALDITEAHRSAQALRESEAKFRTLTETTATGIFIIQGDLFRYMNPAGRRLCGLDDQQLATTPFWEVVHPDHRQMVRARGMARQLGLPVPPHYEFKLVRPDGDERWVDFAAGAMAYRGQPAMLGTVFDITERKLAEEKLRLEEVRLEALTQLTRMQGATPQEIMDFALSQAVELTRSDLGYLGFLDQEQETLTVGTMHGLGKLGPWAKGRDLVFDVAGGGLVTEAARTHRPVVANDLALGANGRDLPPGHPPIHNYLSVPLLDDGHVVALAGVANKEGPYDDSDARQFTLLMEGMWGLLQRARSGQALEESEQRFRSLAENAPDIIYTLAEDGSINYVNPAWRKLLGHRPSEVLGRYFVDLCRPQDTGQMVRLFKRIRDHRLTISEYRGVLPHKDGHPCHFSMSAGPNFDSQGAVSGMVGILKDIGAQMELEAQLRHAQKMEAVGTLAGGVAHEFNNALMAIRGYSQLLGMLPDLPARAASHLARIDQSCARAAALTSKMLTFTRMEVGEQVAVDLNQVAQGICQLLDQTTSPLIEVVLEAQPGLPKVLGDAAQLEQVLFNLALNARDATLGPGRITFTTGLVTLDKEATGQQPWLGPGEYVQVEVADTGRGMPPEVLERVFDPFYTTKEPGKGTGLGLSVAYSIVRGHGGHISARSAPERGSRFILLLPVLDDGQAPAEPPLQPSRPCARGGRERLLVVDDEPSLREIARDMLEAFAYQVETAAHGREALEIYARGIAEGRPFDLVLLDLAMPVMDGLECLRRLRRQHPSAKVLVTSGYGGEVATSFPLEARPQGVLAKPYDLPSLLERVRRVLEGAEEY